VAQGSDFRCDSRRHGTGSGGSTASTVDAPPERRVMRADPGASWARNKGEHGRPRAVMAPNLYGKVWCAPINGDRHATGNQDTDEL
jgi:hypothetical protein